MARNPALSFQADQAVELQSRLRALAGELSRALTQEAHAGGAARTREPLGPLVMRVLFEELIVEVARARGLDVDRIRAASPGLTRLGEVSRQTAGCAHSIAELVREQAASSVELVGASLEALYGTDHCEAEDEPTAQLKRKDDGVYFTPRALVTMLVAHTLGPKLASAKRPEDVLALRVLDPACGSGFFLLETLRCMATRLVELSGGTRSEAQARAEVARSCLYGVDRSGLTADLCRLLLWLESGGQHEVFQSLSRHIRQGDSLLGVEARGQQPRLVPPGENPFFWWSAFPEVLGPEHGGFDIVLGNPPWRKLKREYANTIAENPFFEVQRVQLSGRRTSGDSDFYKYFLELAFRLAHSDGRIGFVVPGSFYQVESATGLRRLFFENGTFELFDSFENRERLFPIHGMFKFLVFAYQKGVPRGIQRARFHLASLSEGQDAGAALSWAFLKRAGGEAQLVPEVRTPAERALFEKLAAAHPPLTDSGRRWRVRFRRELDMTNDSDRFLEATGVLARGAVPDERGLVRASSGEVLWPLYEGRLVHQFDSAAKAYRAGHGRKALWEPIPPERKVLLPHYYVPEASAADADLPRLRAAFCDVTGFANERTVLASIIPARSICGNKVPTLRFEPADDLRLHLLWLAIANSFVVDWFVRRLVSTTLNFYYWKQVPFPDLSLDDPATTALVRAAVAVLEPSWLRQDVLRELAKLDPLLASPSLEGHHGRDSLRAEIDAQVAELYGLDLDDLALVLSDFPLLDRAQPALPLEGRAGTAQEPTSTITRDLVLLAHTRGTREGKAEAGHFASRVEAARRLGAVGYVASELGRAMATERSAAQEHERVA